MTKFAATPEGKAAAERMMRLYGHTNAFQPPKPGFPGDPEKEAKIRNAQPNFVVGATPPPPRGGVGFPKPMPIPGKPVSPTIPNMDGVRPTLRPPGKGTTGGPLVKPPPPGMTGLGSAVKNNPKMAQNLGKLGSGVAKSMGMKKGGAVKKAASAKTSAKTMASRRGDGCAVRGKTKAGIK